MNLRDFTGVSVRGYNENGLGHATHLVNALDFTAPD